MPAMSLLQTYAVDLSPQQGLTLLHETNCMDAERATNASQLALSALTFKRITEKKSPISSSSSFSSSVAISSALSRNPKYQILSVVLCSQQIYDPFQIHPNVPSSYSAAYSGSASADLVQVSETSKKIAQFLNMRPSKFFCNT